MEVTKETIEAVAAELGLTMAAKFVPHSQSRNKADKEPRLNWVVTLRVGDRVVIETDYTAGQGHCPAYKQRGGRTAVARELVRWECEHGKPGFWSYGMGLVLQRSAKPILPALADVLHCLCSDADAIDYGSFEDWANSVGYDPDSRKAEATYRACLELALKLRNGLGDEKLARLRGAVQGY
jgi:hypothetical protein